MKSKKIFVGLLIFAMSLAIWPMSRVNAAYDGGATMLWTKITTYNDGFWPDFGYYFHSRDWYDGTTFVYSVYDENNQSWAGYYTTYLNSNGTNFVTESGRGITPLAVEGDYILYRSKSDTYDSFIIFDKSDSSTSIVIDTNTLGVTDILYASMMNGKVLYSYNNSSPVFKVYDITSGLSGSAINFASVGTPVPAKAVMGYAGKALFLIDEPDAGVAPYYYSVGDSEFTRISGDQSYAIDGNSTYIVYEFDDGNDREIGLYNISSSTTRALTNNSTLDQNPIIRGDKVFYSCGSSDYCIYDITNSKEYVVFGSTINGKFSYDSFRETYPLGTGEYYDTIQTFLGRNADGNHIIIASVAKKDANNKILEKEMYYADFTLINDTTAPVFAALPGTNSQINITEGQTITTNPYNIQVRPTDAGGITKVEFYVDDNLICTETEADSNGVYTCPWDTSRYHSDVRVVVYDIAGYTAEITRTATVDLGYLPTTGLWIWLYGLFPFAIGVPAYALIKKSSKK